MHSHYDPSTGKVVIAPGAPLYTRFHEEAHKEQHESGALCFWVWYWLCHIRFVRYFAILWVEWDAHRRARVAMQKLGLWNDEACQLGKNNLISYAIKKELA